MLVTRSHVDGMKTWTEENMFSVPEQTVSA